MHLHCTCTIHSHVHAHLCILHKLYHWLKTSTCTCTSFSAALSHLSGSSDLPSLDLGRLTTVDGAGAFWYLIGWQSKQCHLKSPANWCEVGGTAHVLHNVVIWGYMYMYMYTPKHCIQLLRTCTSIWDAWRWRLNVRKRVHTRISFWNAAIIQTKGKKVVLPLVLSTALFSPPKMHRRENCWQQNEHNLYKR